MRYLKIKNNFNEEFEHEYINDIDFALILEEVEGHWGEHWHWYSIYQGQVLVDQYYNPAVYNPKPSIMEIK
jgi:hypothetical protein